MEGLIKVDEDTAMVLDRVPTPEELTYCEKQPMLLINLYLVDTLVGLGLNDPVNLDKVQAWLREKGLWPSSYMTIKVVMGATKETDLEQTGRLFIKGMNEEMAKVRALQWRVFV